MTEKPQGKKLTPEELAEDCGWAALRADPDAELLAELKTQARRELSEQLRASVALAEKEEQK